MKEYHTNWSSYISCMQYTPKPKQSSLSVKLIFYWRWDVYRFLGLSPVKGSLFAGSLALVNYPDEVKIVDRHQSISLSFPSWCYLKKLNHIRANKFTQVWNTANAQHHNFKTQCMKQPSAIHLYGRTMLYVQTPVITAWESDDPWRLPKVNAQAPKEGHGWHGDIL